MDKPKNRLFGNIGKITPEKPWARRPDWVRPAGGGRKPPRGPNKFFKARSILKLIATGAAIVFIFGFFLVLIYGYDLPDIDKLYDDQLEQSISILDYKGGPLATYGNNFTEFMQYDNIPQSLIDAVVATEDRRFFSHWGIDPRGLARAMFANVTSGSLSQGGSTITQQLAKIVFLKPERKLKRKIQEAMLAIWLERKFTKEQIITMYLNRVYLGGGIYGIDAAAHKYFNKSARTLNLYESAMMAGMLKAPSTYSPSNNLHLAAERTEQVLMNMVDAEKITKDEMKKALKFGAKVKIQENNPSTKYYTDYVIDQIQELVGKPMEDLVVKTPFRPDLQSLAEHAIEKNMLEFSEKNNAHQAAMVAMKPNGAVLAIIGGADYGESQFNRATQASRQPGSLFKLFVYTAAMLYGKSPDDIVQDEPLVIGSWHPANYDGKLHGPVTLREAFTHSYNLASANLAQEIGTDNVVFIAQKMGIKSPLANVPSIALGSSEVTLLEMTTAFAHLANNGKAVYPYVIEEIRSGTGRTIYQHEEAPERQVLDPETVHKMNDLLLNVVREGTARGAQIGRDAAGKTGTTQDFHDAWFVGFTPQLITGVWVGNDDNAQMKKVTGGSMPARIWAEFMRPAMSGAPVQSIDANYGGWGGSIGNIGNSGVSNDIENFWDNLTSDQNDNKNQRLNNNQRLENRSPSPNNLSLRRRPQNQPRPAGILGQPMEYNYPTDNKDQE